MAIQTAALNKAADGIAGDVTHLSLHTTNGSTDGSGELAGGSYERKAPTYNAASSGTANLDANVVFDGPGSSSEVTHLGFWATSVWLGSAALAESKTISSADTLTITAAPITASAP